jgi:hypothetical protein
LTGWAGLDFHSRSQIPTKSLACRWKGFAQHSVFPYPNYPAYSTNRYQGDHAHRLNVCQYSRNLHHECPHLAPLLPWQRLGFFKFVHNGLECKYLGSSTAAVERVLPKLGFLSNILIFIILFPALTGHEPHATGQWHNKEPKNQYLLA